MGSRADCNQRLKEWNHLKDDLIPQLNLLIRAGGITEDIRVREAIHSMKQHLVMAYRLAVLSHPEFIRRRQGSCR